MELRMRSNETASGGIPGFIVSRPIAHEAIQRFASLPPTGLKTIAAWNALKAKLTHEHPNPRYLEYWERRIEGMPKAGLPEE
jgi:hypothetical protein